MKISYEKLTENVVEEGDSVVDTYGHIYRVEGIDDSKKKSDTEFYIKIPEETILNSVFGILFKKDRKAVYLGERPYEDVIKKLKEGYKLVLSGKEYGTTKGIRDPELWIEGDSEIDTGEGWPDSVFGILFKKDGTAVCLGKEKYESLEKELKERGES